jgi:hypothetical protein
MFLNLAAFKVVSDAVGEVVEVVIGGAAVVEAVAVEVVGGGAAVVEVVAVEVVGGGAAVVEVVAVTVMIGINSLRICAR